MGLFTPLMELSTLLAWRKIRPVTSFHAYSLGRFLKTRASPLNQIMEEIRNDPQNEKK